MTAVAIVGAGPGLGQATARRFGREGFSIALISPPRSAKRRPAGHGSSAGHGITARGCAADMRGPRPPSGSSAAGRRRSRTGRGAAVQPDPRRDFLRGVLETTVATIWLPQRRFSILGHRGDFSSSAGRHRELGRGTVLLVRLPAAPPEQQALRARRPPSPGSRPTVQCFTTRSQAGHSRWATLPSSPERSKEAEIRSMRRTPWPRGYWTMHRQRDRSRHRRRRSLLTVCAASRANVRLPRRSAAAVTGLAPRRRRAGLDPRAGRCRASLGAKSFQR